MFKSINYSIILPLVLLIVCGCQRSVVDALDESQSADGALVLNITRTDAQSDSELLQDATLRIYNSSDRLIARYAYSQIPDAIYLAADTYKATVSIGEQVEISDSDQSIYYYGQTEFTIVGGKVSDLDINCTIQNRIVEVIFDESVFERFELEALCYLCLSDSFSKDDAVSGNVPTLKFTSDGVGYFIMPDDVSNISWGFYGSSESVDPTTAVPSTSAEFSGVIQNPAAATKYTLKFTYSPTAEGALDITVLIDQNLELFDDVVGFSPQPSFTGRDFELFADGLAFTGEDILIDLSSINDLSELIISSSDFADSQIVVMQDGVVSSVDGLSYQATSTTTGVLTLSSELFALFGESGSKTIRFSATDVTGSEGHEDMSILTSGATAPAFDLWANSAQFFADVLLTDADDVSFAYRASDAEDWSYVTASRQGENTYSADVEAVWSSSQNDASLATYTLTSGFLAGRTYQYRLIVDGVEFAPVSATADAGHTIPNGNMNSSSIAAYSTSGSSSGDWTSGNNSLSSDLCDQVTKDGRVCAYLKSRTVANTIFAAGNLAYGQFAMSGFSGTMSFGQPFTWESRPQTFRFSYAATIGDETHDSGNRLDGTDVARVYFAIVDWDSRHGVTASSSGNPSGTWDPATQTSTSEGDIIGYASIMITQSVSSFVDVELPIYYYDNATQPSGDIGIVISCAASAYGDYMTGSTNSRLWVDDFELGY
ncbi:MAG: DUF4493 domain-containing protein [Rikenellaceae bacterium]